MNHRYFVVTPCRNEEKNLPNLMQSILAQTIRPGLWVIVDDGSMDKTAEIITETEKKYDWVKGIYLKKNEEYMGTHLAYVCNKGFEFAKEYYNKNDTPYDYIALVDADNILEAKYFEKLIEEFEKDGKLGIASGNSATADIEKILNDLKIKKSNITVMNREFWQLWDSSFVQIQDSGEDLPMGSARMWNFPIGSARMWRRKCFEETGGYLPVPLPDSVSNAKAKLRGWKTRRFRDIRIIERQGWTRRGVWKGYREKGESYFFLGQSLFLTILKALKYSLKKPHYIGVAYFCGYTKSLICRKERINDDEVRRYYKYIRLRELKAIYNEKIKRLLKKT